MDAAQILVIILSTTLAVFLILAIVLIIILIKIASQIKRVTTTAERAVYKFESIATVVQKAAAPALVTKIIGDFVQRLTKDKKEK